MNQKWNTDRPKWKGDIPPMPSSSPYDAAHAARMQAMKMETAIEMIRAAQHSAPPCGGPKMEKRTLPDRSLMVAATSSR